MTKLKKKIQFWESCVKKRMIECFPTLHDIVAESETPLSPVIASEVIEHLKNLQVSIKEIHS
jgi:hypothetical protein